MSYHSVHMDYPIKGGYRRSQLRPTTVAELRRLNWQILRRADPHLNGNTKWQEMPIVAFYFRNGFIDDHASDDIGFAKGPRGYGGGLKKRLNKVNPQELFSFGIKLMISGLLKKGWGWLLDPTRKPWKAKFSKNRIIFSKAIVNQAITKYGLYKVCLKLRVDMEVIRFWRDYQI